MRKSRAALVATVAAALLATAAPAASADAPTVWVPAHVAAPYVVPSLSAFAGGVGYIAGGKSVGTSGVGTLPEQTERTVELHRTTDYGRTWTRLPGVPADTLVYPSVAFASATEGWVYDRNELLRSTDSGATWSAAATLPLPAGEVLTQSRDGFSISRDGAGMVVAGHVRNPSAVTPADPCGADRGQALLFSDDDGATWNEHRFPEMETGNGVSVESVEAIDGDTAVALTQKLTFDSGCYWSVDELRLDLHVTNDGGATWTTLDPDGATGPSITAATVTGTGVVLAALNDGSVRRSTDGGATFTTAARFSVGGLPTTDLGSAGDLVFAGSTGWATLPTGETFRSTDDGATWVADGVAGANTVMNGLAGPRVAVFDADDAFAVGGAGLVTYRMT